MKTINEVAEILRRHKEELKSKYKIKSLKVLDSRITEFLNYGLEGEKEEVGIVIDYKEPLTLIELISLEEELSSLLDAKVGVYTERGLSSLKKPYNSIEV